MLGVKNVVTAAVLAAMVTMVACQFRLHAGLGAGTDESDAILREVLSDANITHFVDCMIKPWSPTCSERAPIMSIMIKAAVQDELQCKGCSDRVKQQMRFIHTRLRSHQDECVRLLNGSNLGRVARKICIDELPTAKDAKQP